MESRPAQQPRLEELEERLHHKIAQLSDLATMGAVITSISEMHSVLSVVMDLGLRLVDGEVGLIMTDDSGELRSQISWGLDDEFAHALTYQDDGDLPTFCFQQGETVLLNNVGFRYQDRMTVNSILCVPIKTATECFGVILIVNRATGDGFDDEDRQILEMLTSFVAVAIDNSNLVKAKLQQQRIEQEMAIARQIQATILPQDIDTIQGVEIGASYFPAGDVGGDLYDVIPISETNFLAVVGDVSNKGVPAALIMSAAAGILKSTLQSDPEISVSRLTSSLNRVLVEEIIRDREMFVTLFLARFDLDRQKLSFCNAGHLPGLFWRNDEGNVQELSKGGAIVGQFPDLEFTQDEVLLQSGDRLLLFTDGLTEAMDARRQLFGRERVIRLFSEEIDLDPKEFCKRVKERVDNYCEGARKDWQDDFTTLQIKIT